jgi:hypothetical protein
MAERTDPTILGNDVQLGRADRDEGTADATIIRAEIRETRERMGDTIEEIGERLNPNRLKEQVKDNIRDATIGRVETMAQNAADRVSETRRTITNVVRDNPVPAAMVGIGLGWLIWNGRQQGAPVGSSRYARETVKETAGELADRAQEAAGTVAEQTRTQTRRVQEQFYENPLAIGSATLAFGLATGLAVPATRKEAELVGDARDRLVDRVRNVARETTDKVQRVAERVIDETQTTAREEGLAR